MIRTAVVGLGEPADRHAEALNNDPLATLVAVCTGDPAAGARFGVPVYPTLSALLAADQPDLVCVCAPAAADDTRLALEAGASVLCLPPAAPDLQQTARLAALAQERNLVLAGAFNHRFVPVAATARRWVEQGALGTILFAHMSLWEQGGAGPEPFARFRAAAGHAVDLLRYLCGDISEVQSFVSRPGRRDPRDTVNVNLRFASGAVGHFSYSPDMTTRHPWARCEVAGNVARLEIGNVYEEATLYPHAEPEKRVVTNNIWSGLLGYHETWRVRLRHLLQHMDSGTPPAEIAGGAADLVAAQAVVEAAVASASDGEPRKV